MGLARAAAMHSGPNNVIQIGCAHLSAVEKEARTQILTVSDSPTHAASAERGSPVPIQLLIRLPSAAMMMLLHYSSLS